LRGFGFASVISCESGNKVKEAINEGAKVDCALLDVDLPDISVSELIKWIRREQPEPIRMMPILVIAGHAETGFVSSARDAGANLILRKPISPKAIFDRLVWLTQTPRAYVEADQYSGPDRRFKEALPDKANRKRVSDFI
jgi:CheY-like chemotaxis protein